MMINEQIQMSSQQAQNMQKMIDQFAQREQKELLYDKWDKWLTDTGPVANKTDRELYEELKKLQQTKDEQRLNFRERVARKDRQKDAWRPLGYGTSRLEQANQLLSEAAKRQILAEQWNRITFNQDSFTIPNSGAYTYTTTGIQETFQNGGVVNNGVGITVTDVVNLPNTTNGSNYQVYTYPYLNGGQQIENPQLPDNWGVLQNPVFIDQSALIAQLQARIEELERQLGEKQAQEAAIIDELTAGRVARKFRLLN